MYILVTGAAGFIGSQYIRLMAKKYKEDHFICLDKLSYAANKKFPEECDKYGNVTFYKGTIGDQVLLKNLFDTYPLQAIINFAAESHVDRSLISEDAFVESNIVELESLLRSTVAYSSVLYFHQVSTDEVYGQRLSHKVPRFIETSPLHPRNPYSATKAIGELLVQSYGERYSLKVTISRGANTYGPYQHVEKFIPTIIGNALQDRNIPIYGDGLQEREWIYVDDHVTAIDRIWRKGKVTLYNIGSSSYSSNIELAKGILDYLNKPHTLLTFTKDRAYHDRAYGVDWRFLYHELGWKPSTCFHEGLHKTIAYYKDHLFG